MSKSLTYYTISLVATFLSIMSMTFIMTYIALDIITFNAR